MFFCEFCELLFYRTPQWLLLFINVEVSVFTRATVTEILNFHLRKSFQISKVFFETTFRGAIDNWESVKGKLQVCKLQQVIQYKHVGEIKPKAELLLQLRFRTKTFNKKYQNHVKIAVNLSA